ECLPLIAQTSAHQNAVLLGLDKVSEFKTAKLAKIAQTVIKSTQKKFKHITIDISALPDEFHYLFALGLTQAAYQFDEFKSKKNEF
ncbi:M17 family peptidase N-terminal domain-containing protein, partial [Acinetobacter variabilis]